MDDVFREKITALILAVGLDYDEKALGELEGIGRRALPILIEKLYDSDPRVRWGASEALGKIKDSSAVPHLIRRLEDTDPSVRTCAAWSLGGIKDASAAAALIRRLEDEDPGVRVGAAGALGDIGDASAIPALIARLGDEDSEVRRQVLESLWQIDDASIVPLLIVRLGDKYPDARKGVAMALETEIGKGAEVMLDNVRSALLESIRSYGKEDPGIGKEAAGIYIRIADAARRRKTRLDDSIVSEGTVEPPKGKKEGMYRGVKMHV